MSPSTLVEIEDLTVSYPRGRSAIVAVDGLSLRITRGECYALVGESGCGKSAAALALLRLVEPGSIGRGRIVFDGRDLLTLSESEMRAVRGAEIGMVFQDAGSALNPVLRIDTQVTESLIAHGRIRRREIRDAAVRLLQRVALPDAERLARAYPHELSGGMQQRVMLAIALSCAPALLVADEPTTALDVTIQAQILALLRSLRQELGLTILLITHDLGVVAGNADRVGVMYAGRLVEEAPVREIFEAPRHPYTRGLLRSIPAPVAPGSSRRLQTLDGSVPDPASWPPGCRFHPRCPERFAPCDREIPKATATENGARVWCFLHDR